MTVTVVTVTVTVTVMVTVTVTPMSSDIKSVIVHPSKTVSLGKSVQFQAQTSAHRTKSIT